MAAVDYYQETVFPCVRLLIPLVGEKIAVCIPGAEASFCQDASLLPAQLSQGAVPFQQLLILMAPGIAAAVEGVFIPLQTCLIPIIDAGDTGQCELQQGSQLQSPSALFPLFRGKGMTALPFPAVAA